jgi:hypothetical protein
VSDFGRGDRVIERRHVAIFREHFLDIRTPTMKSKESSGAVADALIPLAPRPPRPPVRGHAVRAPRDVNQPLWIDVYVPKTAAPGEYTGMITVSSATQRPLTVPVTLTVWDFELPETPTLRTNFGGLGRRLLTGHAGLKPDTAPYRALERSYADAMAAHRLCPPVPPYLRPKVGPDGAIDPKETHAGLKEWMQTLHVTGFRIDLPDGDPAGKDRDRTVKYLQTLWAYLKENGWEKLAYVFVSDDPNDQKKYDEVRRLAKLVHEAQPGLKVFCTEQPAPENPAWGTLVGSVDIWAPLWPVFDEKSVAERLQAGEEVWSYTTLCQGKPGEDTPFWQLDFPLLHYRIPAWTSRRYGLAGLFYWTAVYWLEVDTWTNPLTHKKQFNGEGCLFYPGSEAGFDGPVASMRLKAPATAERLQCLVLAGEPGAPAAAIAASGRSGERARQPPPREGSRKPSWKKK